MRKIESILVATDLGETSDVVVRAAAGLASLFQAKLHVLHCFELDVTPYIEAAGRTRFDERCAAAERALAEQLERTVPPGVEIASRRVEAYVPHRAVIDAARGYDVDLIVLGPHRPRPLDAGFLGSTADNVIRSAEVPCLVVRGPLSLPLRHVVIPIDLSEAARPAFDVGIAWATALGVRPDDSAGSTRITAVHVVPTMFRVDDFPFDQEVVAPEVHREVEAALARAGAGAPPIREDVRWGDDPAAEVVGLVESEKADLVVMATHGYGALRRALIGSVASGVARRAACPVLLVPPPLWGKDADDGATAGSDAVGE